MFKRALSLPAAGTETFFLWGPRQTGKSTLLRERYPHELWIDLLKPEEYRRYVQSPESLREEITASSRKFVVIDEVQRVPAILDEVHHLHETQGIRFALSGSSARKVRRGQANLLGGRATRYELFGLVSEELGAAFDLVQMLNTGYLPPLVTLTEPTRLLRSYVGDYLKEEIAAEGLVRKLPLFSEFLNVAALSDAEVVNYSTVGRECGASAHTVRNYFQVLEDTLLGRWLPAYRKRPKRRVQQSPKFYFSDVGVVNLLTRRGRLELGSELFGKAFENWIMHELTAYNHYRERYLDLHYWRLASGAEVDFIVGSLDVAIEAKSSKRIHSDHLKGLREIKEEYPAVGQRIVVCLEPKLRRLDDGILIVPYQEFVQMLWSGELF